MNSPDTNTETSRQKILIVDDKKANLFALKKVLQDIDADVVEALSGQEALAAVLEHEFSLMILDVQMPEMDGYELAGYLHGDPKTKDIPIIFLTANHPDEMSIFKGYDAGAIDYITKPYIPRILIGKVRVLLKMWQSQRDLLEHKQSLEILVEQRTHDLTISNSELNQSRRAALNMMEDAILANEKLEMTQFSLDHAADPVYWINSDASFHYVNAAACQSLGYTKEELLKLTVIDIDPSVDPARWTDLWNKVQEKTFIRVESTHLTKDGHLFPVEIHSNTVTFNGKTYHVAFVHDISSRVQADEQIRKSEAQYRSLFDNMASGFALHEMIYDNAGKAVDYRFLRVNPAFEKLTGSKAADILGRTVLEVFPDTEPYWITAYGNVTSTGTPNTFENYSQALEKYFSVRAFRPAPGQFAVVFADVTDQKVSERALRESQERYKSLHNASFGGIAIHDQGIILECNHGMSVLTGYSYDDLIGMNGLDLIAPEFRELVMKNIQTGHEKPYEVTGLRKNGETYPMRLEGRNIVYKDKQVRTVEFRDITEQKKAESELRLLSTAVEQSPETVVITDSEGKIQYANPAFEKTTGYTRQEAIGQNPRVLKSDKHKPEFYTELWNNISSGKTWSDHIINKRKDGSLYTEDAIISPVKDSDGNITNYVAVKRDITEELAMEEQLRQNQKMDSIGQLAGGVAHDLNNLLTPILGYSQILIEDLPLNDLNRESAQEIHQAGKRARDLVRQLLAFSRKQDLEIKPVNINDIIDSFKGILRRSIRENIDFEFSLADNLPNILADTGQIDQIIMNLAVNAQDAMPKGGFLSFETAAITLTEPMVLDYSAPAPGSYVSLTIKDRGTGMSSATLEKIFDPFFTTKEIGKGTGLGLSTVFGIVNQHKGAIKVASQPGKGTTFTILFPVAEDQDKPAEHTAETSNEFQPQTDGMVLLVEDDDMVRTLAIKTLTRSGFTVHPFDCAVKALSFLDSAEISPDLLVTDVVMPGINGHELAKQVKLDHPDCKVLFISGYRNDILTQNDLNAPGVQFLRKPFAIQELRKTVTELLEK